MAYLSSFVFGLIFALGLGLSSMLNPTKIKAFLDITGSWDPSLLIVMLGALLVTGIGFPLVLKKQKPYFNERFDVPNTQMIDRNLVFGAMIFGIGWGLSGLCPGPALANLLLFTPHILFFNGAMVLGMYVAHASRAKAN